ncbi:TetR/AcrR family transcriptional regulator [Rathayibacter sp. VKM Ac-2926]|uniref:TetR/AcrR family transcriptional regulator n=1 Tax=Rathayibacter sp. VKM Ac-2926 TaxID=2929477 RepID=UPI001FB41A15|nr:TetR family transcriptional regulator C-terminal domain-containing protein [Rathayibacter sp. VKM Ac-2926]MCJ1703777.1 TetR family transcriptional regulator C-terminal domain-containing protein [Rathayibacter sp. VKM Ac-2926]
MPKIVDHDARRRAVVDALLTIAHRDGLEAATSRAIAAELGVATGSLWHYFPNFDAVLSGAFDAVFERTNARIAQRTAELSGLEALRAMMTEILPLDETTRSEARLVVSFWGRVAVLGPAAGAAPSVDGEWRITLLQRLREAVALGEIAAEAPLEPVVDLLLSVASGQQVEWVTRGSVIDPERQLALVEAVLSPHRR